MDRRRFLRFLPAIPAAAAAAAVASPAAAAPLPPVALPRIVPGSPMSSAFFNNLLAEIEGALNLSREMCGITDFHRVGIAKGAVFKHTVPAEMLMRKAPSDA